jgi:hypothetical protein
LSAELTPSGTAGLYDAAAHIVAVAGSALGTSPPRAVVGRAFVHRLDDGRLAMTLVGSGLGARLAIEATEMNSAT